MVKRVLYVAIHAWTSPIHVGSHAIAAQFARRGWEVAYVAAPITPLHFLKPYAPQFAWRWREWQLGGGRDLGDRLWHYVPFSLAAPSNRPFFRSEWLFLNWQRLTAPDLLSVVRNAGFGHVDLLILDTIYQPFWLNSVNYDKCLVRLADYNAGFPGFGDGARVSEQKVIDRADLVMTASGGLRDWALSKGAREALYVPNGIDCSRFSEMEPARPVEYVTLQGPIAVFVGDIGAWVDLNLIKTCACALPAVNFVLIGPYSKQVVPNNFPRNVHFLGLRAQTEIPAYLRHANVGLIPFHSEHCSPLIAHINPLKLYEYLAAGLPVVSSRWKEIENLQSPAILCSSPADFLTALKAARVPPLQSAACQKCLRRFAG